MHHCIWSLSVNSRQLKHPCTLLTLLFASVCMFVSRLWNRRPLTNQWAAMSPLRETGLNKLELELLCIYFGQGHTARFTKVWRWTKTYHAPERNALCTHALAHTQAYLSGSINNSHFQSRWSNDDGRGKGAREKKRAWREWTAAWPDMTQQRRLWIYKSNNLTTHCLPVCGCLYFLLG